jgi:broad specificity phosphatase PhoE
MSSHHEAEGGQADEAVELWMIRHGETEWSRSGKHTSHTELELTEEGERVARQLRERLDGVRFDLVLSSPRERARVTAELAGFPDVELDPDLTEWDYGDYEGVTTPEIRETVPGWTVWTHPCPGGESADSVSERMDRLVARVREHGGRVLVFSHGHASRALAARWLGLPVDHGRLFSLDTATISVLSSERGSPTVARWNS